MPLDIDGELERRRQAADQEAVEREAAAERAQRLVELGRQPIAELGRKAVESLRAHGVPETEPGGWRLDDPFGFLSTEGRFGRQPGEFTGVGLDEGELRYWGYTYDPYQGDGTLKHGPYPAEPALKRQIIELIENAPRKARAAELKRVADEAREANEAARRRALVQEANDLASKIASTRDGAARTQLQHELTRLQGIYHFTQEEVPITRPARQSFWQRLTG